MKKVKLKVPDTDVGLECPEEHEEDGGTEMKSEKVNDDTPRPLAYELSFIHTMNEEERNAHIKKCLEMSLEDKITPKNAFALQLIDCLSMLVQEKNDFPTMACTLDAGAKIYSNRVDALHKQVIQLADEIILNMKKKKVCQKDDKEDDNELLTTETRRSRKKGTIILSSESLQRKLKGKDPRSRFIKFDGLPGSITNLVRRNPQDLSYSLEKYLPFWKNWDEHTPLRKEGTVRLSLNIKIMREKKGLNNEQKKDAVQTEPASNKINQATEESTLFNGDSPALELDYDDHVEDVIEMETEDEEPTVKEVGVISTVMKRLSQEFETKGSAPTRLDAMKILFKKSSEYHYLDIKNTQYWAGPEFWKRPKVVVDTNKVKTPRKKKGPAEISYDRILEVDEKWNSLFKKKSVLSKKTVSSWKNNKLTLPKDLKIDINLFFELFHLSNYDGNDENSQSSKELDDYGKQTINNIEQDIINGTVIDGDQQLSSSSTNTDPFNSSFPDCPGTHDQSGAGDNATTPQLTSEASDGQDLGRVISVQVSSKSKSSCDETTLVPAPKLITYEPIKYSVRPIQIDMKHLKEAMLEVIYEEITKDMEQKMAIPCCSFNIIIPETRFSHVLKVLPSKLEKTTAQNLSIPIAFTALLTLTNEHNLQLKDTKNSDVIIRLEEKRGNLH